MKIKVYEALVGSVMYFVEAPNARIAKWCAANLFNNHYFAFVTPREVEVELYKRNHRKKKGGE